ncbi:MAG: hypothetical protein K0R57_2002 [Paenibacillaceae bacterium]|nr:hypothetical protein [Paenibacillaceae bacterium]
MSDNHWKMFIFGYLSAVFISTVVCLLWLMSGGLAENSSAAADWSQIRPYLFYISAGALGGTLYALRTFHQFYDQPVKGRFIYWYLMRPYLCGGTAMITIVLFDSGIMLFQVEDSMTARMGLSFLAGFGYGKFMEKLTHLAEALFNGNGKEKETENGTDGKETGAKVK